MVDVKVKMDNQDLSLREQKIIEVLLLNLAAQANAQSVKVGMALNPLKEEEVEKDNIFSFQFAWQTSISAEQYEEFKEGLKRRFTNAFKMSELSEAHFSFRENSYLTN